MSLIREFTRIMQAAKRQYTNAKSKPFYLTEEICGKNGNLDNMLIHGDNRAAMKALLEQGYGGKIQMIYIDPPFFSKADYDAVAKAGDSKIRHLAYEDKWSKGMSQYLKMLASRLYLMKDLLADDGLIWVHLDWHVVHYAKVLMDEIFGEKHFVNEIIWQYKSGGSSKKHFSRKHDTILVYSKSGKYVFNPLEEKSYNRQYKPYRFKGVKEYKDDLGWYTLVNMKDVWSIDMVGRTSAERTGYATQKPEALIERMIQCCTKEGDICADFFCGSGTLQAVAGRMGRNFIGCDEGSLAIESTVNRLSKAEQTFRVYAMKKTGKAKIEVDLDVVEEEIPMSDKKLLRIQLKDFREKVKSLEDDEKMRETVEKVLSEDPLQMIEAWSIDFDDQDGVHRPDVIFSRTKGELVMSYEKIIQDRKPMCIKIVDIFGNVVYKRY
ncbi:MAG: site-specific DNA-methyltransferase [Firmicutes bacterium]|nr:site-specific DNA-methyltransferase [Bacillota bacterium]